MAVTVAARKAIDVMRERAARIWEVPVDGVVWEDGHARPASSNVGEFEPLSIVDIARKAGVTGGPIAGHAEITAEGAGPASAPISSTSRSTAGPGWSRSCATP